MHLLRPRGHGLSQPKGTTGTRSGPGRGLQEAVLAPSDVDEVVLVGHSVGGMVALDLCAERLQLGKGRGHAFHRRDGAAQHDLPARRRRRSSVARQGRAGHETTLDYVGSRSDHLQRALVKPSDSIFMAVSLAVLGPRPRPAR